MSSQWCAAILIQVTGKNRDKLPEKTHEMFVHIELQRMCDSCASLTISTTFAVVVKAATCGKVRNGSKEIPCGGSARLEAVEWYK